MAVDQQELLPEGMVEDVELGHLALVLVETGMKQQPELGELNIKSIEKNHQRAGQITPGEAGDGPGRLVNVTDRPEKGQERLPLVGVMDMPDKAIGLG